MLSLLAIVSSLLSIAPFVILGKIIDEIVVTNNKVLNIFDGQITSIEITILGLGGFFLVVSISAIIIRNIFGVLTSYLGINIILFYQSKIFQIIVNDRENQFASFSVGDKIQRTLHDTKRLENGISYPLTTFLSDALDIIWISIILAVISPYLVMVAWLSVPVIIWSSWRQSQTQSRYYSKMARTEAQLIRQAERVFNNRLIITSLNGEAYEISTFQKLLKINKVVQYKLNKMVGILFALEGVGRQLGFVTVAIITFILLSINSITIGQTVTVFSIISRFYAPVGSLARFTPTLREVVIALGRIQVILNTNTGASVIKNLSNTFTQIDIKHPVIKQSKNKCLKLSCSFSLSPGKLTILQGPSGIGKTSLLKAMQAVESKILEGFILEGTETKDISHLVQYVSANSVLLMDNVIDEVLYPEIENFDKQSIEKLFIDFGLEYLYQQNKVVGRQISEGERVRLLLARASINNKPILLIDEPFINLDDAAIQKVEAVIQRIIESRKSVLIVTHSVSENLYKMTDQFCTITKATPNSIILR